MMNLQNGNRVFKNVFGHEQSPEIKAYGTFSSNATKKVLH